MRRLALTLVSLLIVLGGVMVVRATRLTPQHLVAPSPDSAIVAATVTTERLRGAVRIPTLSTEDSSTWDPAPFLELHEYLRTAFPRVHAALTRDVINTYSLLYTWKGSDTTLAPLLLMGHLDVVPVEPGTESRWTHPPFSGDTAEGYVWGRGAIDDKVSVIAILEAAELLLTQGFMPQRTMYFAFGHDEEVGGYRGAAELAKTIQGRSGRVAFLVDEGGMISQGIIPGVARPAALIGVVEKSSVSVELTVERPGGHSSVPPEHTAVGILARALTRLEDHQMPARLTPVAERMMTTLAPEMGFGARLAFANLWLLEPMIVAGFVNNATSASLVRTTTAVTMITGSPKQNVLPARARAVVNFRVLPGDTPNDVLAHVRETVADTSVKVSFLGAVRDPSPVADFDTPEFTLLERTITQYFPEAVTVPFLMVAATDTRHYEGLTRNIYRFVPVVATPALLSGPHGTNERIRSDDFVLAVKFFAQLMRNAQ